MTVKWGIVSTIKAETDDILKFAAHHADLGAHRIYIYLDDPNDAALAALKTHPKVRVTTTDDDYWAKRDMKRRVKHQSRQFENARHAYARKPEVDWLTHIDVDEFLCPDRPIAHQLAQLPDDCLCARVRPWEGLANPDGSPPTAFKGFTIQQPDRRDQTALIYPTFGAYLNGGFLSHVAGKMFYRTAVPDLRVHIHNIFVRETQNPGEQTLNDTRLLHLHATSWDQFLRHFKYRLNKGSYRSELSPAIPVDQGGKTLHHLFCALEQDHQLETFFNAVCVATPELSKRLRAENLLFETDLNLDAKRARHFPTAG